MKLYIKDDRRLASVKVKKNIAKGVELFFNTHHVLGSKSPTLVIILEDRTTGGRDSASGAYFQSTAGYDTHYISLQHTIFKKDLYSTLFHELTHMHQALRGDMHFVTGGIRWKGTEHNITRINSLSVKAYNELPWEAEANDVARKILPEFMRSVKGKSLWEWLFGSQDTEEMNFLNTLYTEMSKKQ